MLMDLKTSLWWRTYYVLSGADLLGQVAALHGAEVQVLAEQLPIQDVSHDVLQTPPVGVHHPGKRQAEEAVTSGTWRPVEF